MSNLIGQSLGRYHILEQLGEGGMATVYKAYDTRLETDVAVKVIRTENILPSVLERSLKRFEREAKSLARLTHPNIVKVTDYGEHEGKPYLVMEYLPGGTLKEHLKQGAIPWQEAVQRLIHIAQALEYAHKQNIIHRDVKPSNILLTESGQPMLTDFGVAKLFNMEETSDITGTGMGIGTPEYMAPEQWMGHVTPQTDIYALGVVFYEMVTGRKPYMADTPAALLLKQANDPLPRPKSLVGSLPDAVENVLFKALAKGTEDRYRSMDEFTSALGKLLSLPATRTTREQAQEDQQPIKILRDDRQVASSGKQSIRRLLLLFFGFILLVSLMILGTIFVLNGLKGDGPLSMLATRTPTYTPTYTPTSTFTPTNTLTFTPSATNTQTFTPSPTFTQIPPTNTPSTSYYITNPSSPMRLWITSIRNCTVSVNGVLYDVRGPWKWNWGDGSSLTGWFPQSHTYAGSGSYMITVSAKSGITNSISLYLVCQ